MKRLLPLTGIRFFLALWVVIYHELDPGGFLHPVIGQMPLSVAHLLRGGYLAVSAFFVLSGFVLAYNYSLDRPWGSRQIARFAIARFARIYPAYAVGLLLVAPFIALELAAKFSAGDAVKQAGIAFLNGTLLQSWIPMTALSWNHPGWSLSNEAFFYTCFPILGVALWKVSRWRSLALASVLIAIAAFASPLLWAVARAAGWTSSPAARVFWHNLETYSPLVNLAQFCMGIILCRMYFALEQGRSPLLERGFWLYVPALLLEAAVILYVKFQPDLTSVTLPLHALEILGLALGGGFLSRFLSVRPMIFLGNASYAMYIVHIPVYRWMFVIADHVFHTKLGGFGATSLYVLIVIAAASALYKFIEEPANRILKSWLTARMSSSDPQEIASAAAQRV